MPCSGLLGDIPAPVLPLAHVAQGHSGKQGRGCLVWHHRISAGIKVRALDFLKGAEQAVLAGPADSSLAGWQQNQRAFFHYFVPVPLVSPPVGEILWQGRCALRESWDWELCSTSQEHSEHAGGPWSLAWPSCTMFWVAQGHHGLCQPCFKTPPPGKALVSHQEPMLRLGSLPASAGHLRPDCVLLHEYDPSHPGNLNNPKLRTSFCFTCSISSYRVVHQRKGNFALVSQ